MHRSADIARQAASSKTTGGNGATALPSDRGVGTPASRCAHADSNTHNTPQGPLWSAFYMIYVHSCRARRFGLRRYRPLFLEDAPDNSVTTALFAASSGLASSPSGGQTVSVNRRLVAESELRGIQAIQASLSGTAYPSLMSLILATQVTAVATAFLAAFAIITAIFAVLAFRKQSIEVQDQAGMLQVQSKQLTEQQRINERHIKVLELQAIELHDSTAVRKHEAELVRRAQASRVFITQERELDLDAIDRYPGPRDAGHRVKATVLNSSDQPIYGAEIRWHLGTAGHANTDSDLVGTIMPGAEAISTRPLPPDAQVNITGADVRFTDGSGARWLRRLDGDLDELRAD
jgi:hypothetical protein